MPNFTERAIKESFVRLLNEKPLSQISVRMIAEDCGINRNSFYYHYRDIPSLIEDIVKDEVGALIEKYPTITSLDECASIAFEFMVKNRRAVYHIFNSANRDIYERYLMKICEYIVLTYMDTVFGKDTIPPSDRETVIRFFKCEIFGLSYEWILSGMKEDGAVQIHRITAVCHGLSDEIIRRIRETK